MKNIVIIIAMQEEIEPLLPQFGAFKQENLHGFDVLVCEHPNLAIHIIKSGIGKVNAAVATTLAYHAYHPDLVINLGSSAGLESTLKPGSIVIAETLSYYDVDVTAFNYQMGQVPKMPAIYEAHSPIIEKIKMLHQKNSHSDIQYGLVLSGDSFLMCEKKIEEIKKYFPTVHAIDMESTAIAQACHRLSIPCLIIRSITDSGDATAKETHEDFLEYSQKQISYFITSLLNEISGLEKII